MDPRFQVVHRVFVLISDVTANRLGHSRDYFLTVKIEDSNVITDGKNAFDHTNKNDIKAYKNIRKITTAQGDD